MREYTPPYLLHTYILGYSGEHLSGALQYLLQKFTSRLPLVYICKYFDPDMILTLTLETLRWMFAGIVVTLVISRYHTLRYTIGEAFSTAFLTLMRHDYGICTCLSCIDTGVTFHLPGVEFYGRRYYEESSTSAYLHIYTHNLCQQYRRSCARMLQLCNSDSSSGWQLELGLSPYVADLGH